jgi:hypothetical protein
MSLEEKRCTKCGLLKSFAAFNNDKRAKDGKAYQCKQCAKLSPEKKREATLKHRYGITTNIYDELSTKQLHRCALCSTDVPGGTRTKFLVDHNHETGEVRGLLCYSCNNGLGMFQDSQKLLQRAIQYLNDNGHYGDWTD